VTFRRPSKTVFLLGVAVVALAIIGLSAVTMLAAARGTTPTEAMAAPHFVDETAVAGLDHVYDGDFVGGGVATFDCDDDGRPEIYLAGGDHPAALFENASPIGGPLRFIARPDATTDLTGVNGAYPLDIDGDGQVDLAILRNGENVLLRGLGGCRFERANETWSFDGGDARTMAFSATWEDGAVLPTLSIGDYVALESSGTPILPCPDNTLLRPRADGSGYGDPIALAPGACALSMLFSDWDRSGRRDLRVSNDRQYYTDMQEQLWRIEPGEPPYRYTADDGWVSMQIWGMGIASRDLTGDGYPEVYLTSQGDNKLQTLLAGPDRPTYRDIALRRGVNAAQPFTGGDALPSTAWHPQFEDVNDDGFVDLFVTKGNVSAQEGYATRDPSELLVGAADGTFRQGTEEAGLVRFERGRGAAVVDLDLDGLLDIVKVDLGAPVELWHNTGAGDDTTPVAMGHWLQLQLRQPGPDRDAVGAWLEVKVGETILQREVAVGGGHISGQAGWIHVGLGPSDRAELRVTWPDGQVEPWRPVSADQFLVIERGVPDPTAWSPHDAAP
jgi:enediyne biosynthesis protein E4